MTPENAEGKRLDIEQWVAYFRVLKASAKKAGFVCKLSTNAAGPASYVTFYLRLTGKQTDVEVFTTTSGPDAEDSALVVRQFRNHLEGAGPAPNSRSGPNHTRGNVDVTAALQLIELLAAMPYESFKCAHCGADEGQRNFLGDPIVKAVAS
jgi:hypothetical protein